MGTNGGEDWPLASGYGNTIDVSAGPRSVFQYGMTWTSLEGGDWQRLDLLQEIEVKSAMTPGVLVAPRPIEFPLVGPATWLGRLTRVISLTSTASIWFSSAWAASEVLPGDRIEKYITLYRGVSVKHPDYPNALNGVATPIGGHNDPTKHNDGNNKKHFYLLEHIRRSSD